MVGSITDQPVQQTVHEGRQPWPVTIEEEHQHQAQCQFEHAAADPRTAHQQPVGDLADIRPDAGDQSSALLVHRVPEVHQRITDQRQFTEPFRRRRQPFDLQVVQQRVGVANLIGDVEPQPYQWHGHQHHPAEGEQPRRERGVAVQPAGQQAHHRPAGECQHGGPEQGRRKRRQHPETGCQQAEQQDLRKQAIIVEHGKLL